MAALGACPDLVFRRWPPGRLIGSVCRLVIYGACERQAVHSFISPDEVRKWRLYCRHLLVFVWLSIIKAERSGGREAAAPGPARQASCPPYRSRSVRATAPASVMENVWQFMRDNWLSNRVFRNHDDIVAHCCHAWNRLVDQPWRIMFIGLCEWAHGS